MIVMAVCHFDDTNLNGGLEKQVRLLSRTLKAAGEDVVILASTRKWSRAGWHEEGGVPVRLFWTYTTPQISGRYLPASLLWAAQLLLWVTLNRARIDVLHIHQIRIHAFVAALARRWFGIPNILKSGTGGEGADIRAIGTHKYFGAAGRRFVIAHGDVFIATTQSIREDLLHWGVPDEHIEVVPNGFDMPAPQEGAPAAERLKRLLFLGRFEDDKNVIPLAEAAIGRDFELDFYGGGWQEEALKDVCARDPSGRVAVKGWISDPERIIGEYGFLLLPSNAEGLSNSMLEAMSQGVVPVATRVSGCIDHIEDGVNGFFLEGTDSESLTQGLERVGDVSLEEWRKMSRATMDYARSRFDMKVVGAAYRGIYDRLAGRDGARTSAGSGKEKGVEGGA